MMPSRSFALQTVSAFLLAASLSGCMSSVHRQSVQLASATTPVVEQADSAYQSANSLFNDAADAQAVLLFDRPGTVYNPRTSTFVLMSDQDIEIRLKVLRAFQLYVDTVVEITTGVDSPALNSAAETFGANLTTVANQVAPAIERAANVASPAATPITPVMRNGISTAANALGRFLVYRTIRQKLPGIVIQMDAHVKVLCDLLTSDLDILQDQQKRDTDTLIDLERGFIRNSPTLSPADRRREIMKLPAIVRRERTSQDQLTQLRASIVHLQQTHHTLALEIQTNPDSLKQKIAELAAAGNSLGTFYTSLPTT